MVVTIGEKLHIITRRLFEGDLRRHFVGEIAEVDGSLVRITGYSIIFDPWTNEHIKQTELRERVFNLGEAGLIVNILPKTLQVEKVDYRLTRDGRLVMTDGEGFMLDINEFSGRR